MSDYLIAKLEEHYYKYTGLLIGYGLLFIFIISADAFLEKGIQDYTQRILVYIVVGLTWALVWLLSQDYMPNNDKKKIGIIIAITTENAKQVIRIRKDIAGQLKKALDESGLDSLYKIIVFNDFQSEKLISIIKPMLDKKNEVLQNPALLLKYPTEIKTWDKINKKIKGHLYIYGDIKERQDNENTYFLDLNGLIVHRPVEIKIANKVRDEFVAVLKKDLHFPERFELKGFELTGNMVYLVARYITGIAALISGDPSTAYKLHKGLKDEFKRVDAQLLPNYDRIKVSLNNFISDELYYLASFEYYKNSDIQKTNFYIDEALKSNPLNYNACILKSCTTFIDKKPIESLKLVNKASKLTTKDFAWLYNKAFLFMYLEKFDKGIKCYKKLTSVSFPGEESIIDQCIDFNKGMLKDNADKKQILFILGFLYYKKKANLPMALQYFEAFKTQGAELKYNILLSRVETYLSEIRKGMNLR